jgi:hypothetical protein
MDHDIEWSHLIRNLHFRCIIKEKRKDSHLREKKTNYERGNWPLFVINFDADPT